MMNFLRYVQAVLWGFTGLGRRQDMAKVVGSGNPLGLIAVGLLLAAIFIAVLVGLAILAVSSLS